MNKRGCGLTRNSWSVNRKHSVEYSRHLCDITRSTTLMASKRPRAFSDSGAIAFHSQTYHGQYKDFRKKNLTLGRQGIVEGVSSQRRVYNLDKTFHRKFGRNESLEETRYSPALAAIPHQVNREASPRNSVYCGVDDDERSFCDSISSCACSDFPKADAEKPSKWAKDESVSHKNAKFDAIEMWLQHLPKPVLKPRL